jgi:hypothetical protein
VPGKEFFVCEISHLFQPSSPIRELSCDVRRFATDKLLQLLATKLSLTKILLCGRSAVDRVMRLLKVVSENYDVDLEPSAIEFVDMRVAISSYKQLKEDRLNKLQRILAQLRTILLPVDRGLFQLIPDEILLPIYQKATYRAIDNIDIEDKHLFKLFEVARQRELCQLPDQRGFITKLWIELFRDSAHCK